MEFQILLLYINSTTQLYNQFMFISPVTTEDDQRMSRFLKIVVLFHKWKKIHVLRKVKLLEMPFSLKFILFQEI